MRYPLRKGTLVGISWKIIEQRLIFDEMMGVKLASVVCTNDAGKQFSIVMPNRKAFTESKCYFLEFKSNLDIALLIIFASSSGTQIKDLYKLASVTKEKLFASY